MKYILEKDDENYELMGGKATALSKIGKVIDNIPDWFVVSFKGFDINNKIIKEEAKLEKLISPVKNSNLSPFEKYIAIYNIVKNFKEYNEAPNNSSHKKTNSINKNLNQLESSKINTSNIKQIIC